MQYDKLVLFGDSYSIEYEHDDHCWYNKLASKLAILPNKIVNFAVKGSSLEYSTARLYEYLSSDQYSQSDLIIFIPTAFGRNPLVGEQIDPECAFFLKEFLAGDYDKKIRFYGHYREYREFYKTLLQFANEKLFQAQMFMVAMTLKQLPNMALMIPAFKNYFKDIDLLSDSSTFMMINLVLFDIDKNEIDSPMYYDLRYFFKGDPRYCHMTKTNNEILATQLYKAIVNRDVRFINAAEYKTKIIKLSAEFESLYQEELQPIYTNYKVTPDWWAGFGKTTLL